MHLGSLTLEHMFLIISLVAKHHKFSDKHQVVIIPIEGKSYFCLKY